MDAHDSRTGFRRTTLTQLLMTLSAALVLAFGFAAGTAQMPEQGKKKEVFVDDDLKEGKVPGVWQVVTVFDRSQLDDPAVPVVVDAIMTFGGKGKYVGRVKIAEVGVKNRGAKAVRSLQLRWAFAAFNEPDAALLEGYTPFFDAQIEANASRDVEIPPVFFNREIKRLTKGGELHGDFYLRVGVQEVRFDDGSVWRRKPPAGSLKSIYLDGISRGQFRQLLR